MSAFTQTKSGPVSDPTTFGGAAGGSVPASGDSIDVKGFCLFFDKSIGSSGVTLNDTSTSDGYVAIGEGVTVLIAGLTGGIRLLGQSTIEFMTAGSYHVG
jgi:hypothetical protein